MEDNIYELSKAWQQLDENFTRLDEKKSKKGLSTNDPHSATHGRATQFHKPGKGKGSYDRKEFRKATKEIDENVGAGAATAIPVDGANTPQTGMTGAAGQAQFKKKLGEKKKKVVKEDFDIATLAGPQAAEVDVEPEVESPAVSDIIASLQARYPGAVIEITVTAPEGHCFTDADVSTATEVANATEEPEELGGAWEKAGEENGEEEEMEDSDTKPLSEAYPPSFGKTEEKEESEKGEEKEDEEKEETEDKEGVEETKDEGEGEEGEVETASGISKDSISLSPECWSAFLVKADSQETPEMGETEEETEETDEENGTTPPLFEGKGTQHGMGDSSTTSKQKKLKKGKDGKVTDEEGNEYEDNGEGYYRRKK